jgi:hexosaminidase
MLFWMTLVSLNSAAFAVIPKPIEVKNGEGTYFLKPGGRLSVEHPQDLKTARYLGQYLTSYYRLTLPVVAKAAADEPQSDVIRLRRATLSGPAHAAGGYELTVGAGGIEIRAHDGPGMFYGVQTLIQLLPAAGGSQGRAVPLPQLTVVDAPRFQYRGLHLDVARHWFPVEFVKKYIDFIALHKMNTFHWHLTDDQGWRIEIKKFPKLTGVGGCREGSQIGNDEQNGHDGIRHCGFYTQEQIREVVQYASDRFITVIPEIEMPGHSSAALASYPELGCMQGPYSVRTAWGVSNEVFCAGREGTFRFLEQVLDEVIALFPSPYIHIGGDEVSRKNWRKCSECQARIKQEHLKDDIGLQSYFVQRMERYVNNKGRKIIGWDEILAGGLAPNATVLSWRGVASGIAAARLHHNVIMNPADFLYLDHAQARNESELTIGGYTPVEKVYRYDPVPAELSAEESSYIIGAQANVWTEYMTTPAKVEYMLFPRLAAVSEMLWTQKDRREWEDFHLRLPEQLARYRLWKVNFNPKGVRDGE